jgi:hypothetical protein
MEWNRNRNRSARYKTLIYVKSIEKKKRLSLRITSALRRREKRRLRRRGKMEERRSRAEG